MKSKIWSWVLKAPLILLGLIAIPAEIYAASQNIIPGYGSIVITSIIMILYFAGEYLAAKKR